MMILAKALALSLAAAAFSIVADGSKFPFQLHHFALIAYPIGLLGAVWVALDHDEDISNPKRYWTSLVAGSIFGCSLGAATGIWGMDLGWGSLILAVLGGACPKWVLEQAKRALSRGTDNESS